METVEQILTRQHATLNFRNNQVEYFSISAQHGRADTINEAVENILKADKRYGGRAPLSHAMANFTISKEKVEHAIKHMGDTDDIVGCTIKWIIENSQRGNDEKV